MFLGRIGRHLRQLDVVGIFDSYRVNGDTSSTEFSRWLANIILGFPICDDQCHLLDTFVSPAASLFGEDVLLSVFQSSSGVRASSVVRQDLDELKDFTLVVEGVEVNLCCGLVVVHDDSHSHSGRTDIKAIYNPVQESANQLEIGGTDGSRLVNDEHDVS